MYDNPFQLLVATILSAQATDKQVNRITAPLFQECKGAEDLLQLGQEQLEQRIKGCGLFRSKTKYLLKTCNLLLEEYQGQVPESREELMKLPGVGRKTANVILSTAFGQQALAVDTHVFRVANRLGLASSDQVLETEKELMEVIPAHQWSQAHHWLIYHGREICKARNPDCDHCQLADLCHFREENECSTEK